MREFLEWFLAMILTLATIIILIQIRHSKANAATCLDSEYKTANYKVILGVLYCKDTGDGWQPLRKKYVSDHMKEHKANW